MSYNKFKVIEMRIFLIIYLIMEFYYRYMTKKAKINFSNNKKIY